MTAPSPVDGDLIRLHVADRVAVITLNRPEARNALSPSLAAALHQTVISLGVRDDVGAIVLTGADPAFCAGADLDVLRGSTGREWLHRAVVKARGVLIPDVGLPIIGAVNGAAVTGGLELALQCDILIASDQARFGDTHVRVGIVSGGSTASLLPDAVGIRRARQLSFTGELIDADTALTWGLVNQVVPHEQLLPVAVGIAAQMAARDPEVLRFMRRTYQLMTEETDATRHDLEVKRFAAWQDQTKDFERHR